MTLRQVNFLFIFFVFLIFQFSLFIVRNVATIFSVEQVEAFYLVILISLLSLALSRKKDSARSFVVALGTTTGLGIYFLFRQFFIETKLDWFVFISLIAGALVAVLLQIAAKAICKSPSD